MAFYIDVVQIVRNINIFSCCELSSISMSHDLQVLDKRRLFFRVTNLLYWFSYLKLAGSVILYHNSIYCTFVNFIGGEQYCLFAIGNIAWCLYKMHVIWKRFSAARRCQRRLTLPKTVSLNSHRLLRCSLSQTLVVNSSKIKLSNLWKLEKALQIDASYTICSWK